MISAVIFDRDGVLTRFDNEAAAAFFQSLLPVSMTELGSYWEEWGKIFGFPCNLNEEELFWQGLWEYIGDNLDLPPVARMQLQNIDYKAFIMPFADARDALLIARQQGLRTGVLSNFPLASLSASLAAVGLADFIDATCAATVMGMAKPKPDAYLTITRSLNVLPQECLLFDDEVVYVEGARALGIQAYLVDRRQTEHQFDHGTVCDLSALSLILDNNTR